MATPATTPTNRAAPEGRMLYVHALSPIHSGTGQSTEGIDLPVAREKITGWPYLPGSSVKGVLRDACLPEEGADAARQKAFVEAFGSPTDVDNPNAGGLWFSDARLLCLPVRSLHGSFAWVTCPLALERWRRDYRTGGERTLGLTVPTLGEEAIQLTDAARATLAPTGTVYLEDLDLPARADQAAAVQAVAERIAAACFADDAWRQVFAKRFGVVTDETFTFLAETATEVIARIKLIAETKTVQDGGLWYEEAVPAESIFACPVVAARHGITRMNGHNGAVGLWGAVESELSGPVQIGGGASIGRGLVSLRLEPAPHATGTTAVAS